MCAPVQERGLGFDFAAEFAYQEELHGLEGRPPSPLLSSGGTGGDSTHSGLPPQPHYGPQWALLRFSQPVTAPKVPLHACLNEGLADPVSSMSGRLTPQRACVCLGCCGTLRCRACKMKG